MDPNAEKDDKRPGQTTASGNALNDSGLLENALALWSELRGLSHDGLRLAALETRQAGMSLVTMIVAGVMVAVLLNVVWLGLMAAAVQWSIENGIMPSSAIMLAVAFHLLLVLILFSVIRRKSRFLGFPATLRSLKSTPAERRDAGKS